MDCASRKGSTKERCKIEDCRRRLSKFKRDERGGIVPGSVQPTGKDGLIGI
jgi:hypothetical protein